MPKISTRSRQRRDRQRALAAKAHGGRVQPQKATYTVAYRKWLVGRVFGFVLMGIGVVMAVVHIGAHLGNFSLLPTVALEDLLIGWPMAGVLFIIGGVLASRRLRA